MPGNKTTKKVKLPVKNINAKHISIDVDNLNHESLNILVNYLNERPNVSVLAPSYKMPRREEELYYDIDDNTQFTINRTLISYECLSKKNRSIFTLLSEKNCQKRLLPIGENFEHQGRMSEIKKPAAVQHTIGYKKNKYWLKPNEKKPSQDRLIKTIYARNKQAIQREAYFMKKMGYLHAKDAAIYRPLGSPYYIGYIPMRKIPGIELQEIFTGYKKNNEIHQKKPDQPDNINKANDNPITLEKLTAHEKIKHMLALAKAVAELHEQHQIIHRDLKPNNIKMHVTATGVHAYILDFGLAKSVHEHDAGIKCGTAEYMSYEANNRHGTSSASDVLALGRMLGTYVGASDPTAVRTRLRQAKYANYSEIKGSLILNLQKKLTNKDLPEKEVKEIKASISQLKKEIMAEIDSEITERLVNNYQFEGLNLASIPKPYDAQLKVMLVNSQRRDPALRPRALDFVKLLEQIDFAMEANKIIESTNTALNNAITFIISRPPADHIPQPQLLLTLEQLKLQITLNFSKLKHDKNAKLQDFEKLQVIAETTNTFINDISACDQFKQFQKIISDYQKNCRQQNPISPIKKLLFKLYSLANKLMCTKIAIQHSQAVLPEAIVNKEELENYNAGFLGTKLSYQCKLAALTNQLIIHSSMFATRIGAKKPSKGEADTGELDADKLMSSHM
jgi:serine/threonine protein kinase/DNA-directed RNA polymerase subunit L